MTSMERYTYLSWLFPYIGLMEAKISLLSSSNIAREICTVLVMAMLTMQEARLLVERPHLSPVRESNLHVEPVEGDTPTGSHMVDRDGVEVGLLGCEVHWLGVAVGLTIREREAHWNFQGLLQSHLVEKSTVL